MEELDCWTVTFEIGDIIQPFIDVLFVKALRTV